MPGNSYELFGGPCHWDLVLHFYVVLGLKLATAEGCVDGDGNIREPRLNAVSRRFVTRLERSFHRTWNPGWNPATKKGTWKLYDFAPCCSFHIDATFEVAPASLRGQNMSKEEVRRRLPEHYGVIVIEDIEGNVNPHADLHGKIVVMSPDDIDDSTFAHELGHIMGLPDQHKHAHVHVPPDEERRHRGHLMGTAVNGRRQIAQHEIDEIAAHAGMTCDRETCCPREQRTAENKKTRRAGRDAPVRTPCTRDPLPGGVLGTWDYVLAR
ncbi:MAG: hypothetical protein AB7F74_24255 [Parvibaculaceae bacterium]